jgi:hypothetical protein
VLAAAIALIMSCAKMVVSLLATDETLTSTDSSFTQPLAALGSARGSAGSASG